MSRLGAVRQDSLTRISGTLGVEVSQSVSRLRAVRELGDGRNRVRLGVWCCWIVGHSHSGANFCCRQPELQFWL